MNSLKWIEELNKFEDLIMCPYCLQPCYLVNYLNPANPKVHAYQCRNERCYAFSEWITIHAYHRQFPRILELTKDGHTFPKKVIKLAEAISNG